MSDNAAFWYGGLRAVISYLISIAIATGIHWLDPSYSIMPGATFIMAMVALWNGYEQKARMQ